jgi:heparanase 1
MRFADLRSVAFFCGLFLPSSLPALAQVTLHPQTMAKAGEVDPRFLSYNVEAVEVTGGRFWKPYDQEVEARLAAASEAGPRQNQPIGMDPSLFQYRAPIDLSNARLRKLAKNLEPAYIRVSGTWRNSTFFQDDDEPALKTPPEGFNGVLTRAQWKGVVDFAHAVGAEIMTSVATSTGTRDASGLWTPKKAKAFFDYTRQIGGHIAATEFMNEPNYAVIGGAPKGYDAQAFGRDVKAFRAFLKSESPSTLFLGPGSVGEGILLVPPGSGPSMPFIKTEDMLKATGPAFDVFSYHFYGAISHRCAASLGPAAGMSADKALTPEWFERNLAVEAFYAKLRDQYVPGKDIWLNETGEAACGGDKWAADFIDSFRYLDQLGSLAQKSVKVVAHNTLASSDYGLLDEQTLEPRPNYWAALLWKRTMGTRSLKPGIAPNSSLRIYAQCMKDAPGGVTLLVMNIDATAEHSISVPLAGERYTLSASELTSRTVLLNGTELKLTPEGDLPSIQGQPAPKGTLHLAPLTISFLTLPRAANSACQLPRS